jgi:hypothetical protein
MNHYYSQNMKSEGDYHQKQYSQMYSDYNPSMMYSQGNGLPMGQHSYQNMQPGYEMSQSMHNPMGYPMPSQMSQNVPSQYPYMQHQMSQNMQHQMPQKSQNMQYQMYQNMPSQMHQSRMPPVEPKIEADTKYSNQSQSKFSFKRKQRAPMKSDNPLIIEK